MALDSFSQNMHIGLVNSLAALWGEKIALEKHIKRTELRSYEMRNLGDLVETVFNEGYLLLCIPSISFAAIVMVVLAQPHQLTWGTVLLPLTVGVSSPALIMWLLSEWSRRQLVKLQDSRVLLEEKVQTLSHSWSSLAQAEHTRRLTAIDQDLLLSLRDPRALHERQMAEIAVEHERAIATIAQHYKEI